jgi:hypothetical protein
VAPRTLEHENKCSKGLLAARKAVSSLISAEHAARLAFDKVNQEGRLSLERLEGSHVALDRAKDCMCLVGPAPGRTWG